ncbi:MAG: c-type cytochrome [Actinomycetota bacterium]
MKFEYKAILALAVVAVLSVPAEASQELIRKARCVACHAVDSKRVGPAYRDVAEKYRGQADAPGHLFDKVRQGGTGNWGQIPMPPHGEDKISDADLKAVIQWILEGAKG